MKPQLRRSANGEIPVADWTRKSVPSAFQELLSIASRPGVIPFALGLPAPELFPIRDIAEVHRYPFRRKYQARRL